MATNKIRFADPRKTTTISLPSFEGSEVTVYQKLLTAEQEEIYSRFPNASKWGAEGLKATVAMIANCIKSHNFIDDDGKDMEFNEAMVRQLPDDDLLALSCAVTGKTMEELQKVAESGNVSDSEKKSQ